MHNCRFQGVFNLPEQKNESPAARTRVTTVKLSAVSLSLWEHMPCASLGLLEPLAMPAPEPWSPVHSCPGHSLLPHKETPGLMDSCSLAQGHPSLKLVSQAA